jgi:hypothetical protein
LDDDEATSFSAYFLSGIAVGGMSADASRNGRGCGSGDDAATCNRCSNSSAAAKRYSDAVSNQHTDTNATTDADANAYTQLDANEYRAADVSTDEHRIATQYNSTDDFADSVSDTSHTEQRSQRDRCANLDTTAG